MPHNLFNSLQEFDLGTGTIGQFYSLPELEKQGIARISTLPVSIRIVLESVLRNFDGRRIREEDVRVLANWQPQVERTAEIPFVVARIVLQDFTGVPLLVDLAAMRSAVANLGKNPKIIEPLVPVDLVVDHSVQVDVAGTADALQRNMEIEFVRNRQRYEFLKWGMQAFDTFKVVPPGIGIIHQVNLEYLAKGVLEKEGIYYPDTLVGTDSHTTMINGLGVVGWGVGGIEAEAGMLGQPVYFLTPDVVGFNLVGSLREGVTATDLVLTITEMLRKAKVVGKFVEFCGAGTASLSVVDRATIANMAPEYGATMGFFPIDEETCNYLRFTGRTPEQVSAFRNYYQAQQMFGVPEKGAIEYSQLLELDLSTVQPSVAGPKRPQDRIELTKLKAQFTSSFSRPVSDNGFGKNPNDLCKKFPSFIPQTRDSLTQLGEERSSKDLATEIGHGDVLIAAITSCTNTSNPSVMLAAGIVAKKAVEKGLQVKPIVKTSLGPGSRVVTEYLEKTGLLPYLNKLGFNVVGYGCTTCIGNSGPLYSQIEETVLQNDLVAVSVLSGNRNFEARVHQAIKANFLMSPPLVVAFALAGNINVDLTSEPIGQSENGGKIFLKDIWPTQEEVRDVLQAATDAETYRKLYADFTSENPLWNEIPASQGDIYAWDANSTYIQQPPFFTNFAMTPGSIDNIRGARALGIFGDSVTTDHISPAGSIKATSPAGLYLQEQGVKPLDFNSYGSRRGNDRVMTRGTFANVRIKNLMVPGIEGGVTKFMPGDEVMSIYDAAVKYRETNTPLVIFAGQEYGTGSSRDWAAKGTSLLGVRAVIAQSFERIHRSNLVGMGVLPLQFKEETSSRSLNLTGRESFDLIGLDQHIKPRQDITLVIHHQDGRRQEVPVTLRIDTAIEVDYYQHGGILPYVLRQLVAQG